MQDIITDEKTQRNGKQGSSFIPICQMALVQVSIACFISELLSCCLRTWQDNNFRQALTNKGKKNIDDQFSGT
jgi:hypothetical protein